MVGDAALGDALASADGLAGGADGDPAPKRATAIAANAMTRSATRITWPARRRAGSETCRPGRGRSRRIGVVRAIGRRAGERRRPSGRAMRPTPAPAETL